MIAANMKPLYEKEARERQIKLAGTRLTDDLRDHGREGIEKGRTSEIVGNMFGVSAKTVDRASAVIKNGVEELQEAVNPGKSAFQQVGGCKKYTYFVYIWDTLYLKYFVISSGGYQNLSFFVYI